MAFKISNLKPDVSGKHWASDHFIKQKPHTDFLKGGRVEGPNRSHVLALDNASLQPSASIRQKQNAYVAKVNLTGNTPPNRNDFIFNSFAHANHSDAPPVRVSGGSSSQIRETLQKLGVNLTNVPEHIHRDVWYVAQMENALKTGHLNPGDAVNKIFDDFDRIRVDGHTLEAPGPSFDRKLEGPNIRDTTAAGAGSWQNKNIQFVRDVDEPTRRLLSDALDRLAQTRAGATLLNHVYALPIPVLVAKGGVAGLESRYVNPIGVNLAGDAILNVDSDVLRAYIVGPRIDSGATLVTGRDADRLIEIPYDEVLGHELVHAALGFKTIKLEVAVRQAQAQGTLSEQEANSLIHAIEMADEDAAVRWQHVYAAERGTDKRYWVYDDREVAVPLKIEQLRRNNEGEVFLAFDNNRLRPVRSHEIPLTYHVNENRPIKSPAYSLPNQDQLHDYFLTGARLPADGPIAYRVSGGALSEGDWSRIENRQLKHSVSDQPVVLRLSNALVPQLVLTLPGGAQVSVTVDTYAALVGQEFAQIPLVVERRDGSLFVPTPQQMTKASGPGQGGVSAFLPEIYNVQTQ